MPIGHLCDRLSLATLAVQAPAHCCQVEDKLNKIGAKRRLEACADGQLLPEDERPSAVELRRFSEGRAKNQHEREKKKARLSRQLGGDKAPPHKFPSGAAVQCPLLLRAFLTLTRL